jgi:Acetyltransferases
MRPARLSDIDALVLLEARCFATDKIAKRQWRYLIQRSRARVWVIEGTEGLAANAVLLCPLKSRSSRLYSLAVAPEYRGQGLARQLLKNILAFSRRVGYRCVTLEVREQDAATVRLYQSVGFQTDSRLPSYYQDQASALRMRAELS